MIIFLGRQSPGASSDLPGSRNGPGRSVSGRPDETQRQNRPASSIQSALLPYLVLLPMGFAEPGRSPGLLVSSYLAVSPLPRPERRALRPRRFIFCGTVPIRAANPDGGRYPPPRPMESGLSSVARPSARAAGPVSRPGSESRGAAAIIAPATDLHFIIGARPLRNNPRRRETGPQAEIAGERMGTGRAAMSLL